MIKRALSILFFLGTLTVLFTQTPGAEFYGVSPTGFLLLEDKHPYYLFVPQEYVPEKGWPLAILIGDRGAEPKEVVAPWIEWAKKNRFLILALPNLALQRGEIPKVADDWLLQAKEGVAQRYRIDRSQILLIGIGFGAHYASYLSVQYPENFAAAVLIQGSWAGPFEKLIRPLSDPDKQISFYVSVDPKGLEFKRLETKSLEFEKKGYRITFDPLGTEEDFSTHYDRMTAWFRKEIEYRTFMREKPRKTKKEKIKGVWNDLFEM